MSAKRNKWAKAQHGDYYESNQRGRDVEAVLGDDGLTVDVYVCGYGGYHETMLVPMAIVEEMFAARGIKLVRGAQQGRDNPRLPPSDD